jgi:hypothetical protein
VTDKHSQELLSTVYTDYDILQMNVTCELVSAVLGVGCLVARGVEEDGGMTATTGHRRETARGTPLAARWPLLA